jgi:hypothetical protein
MYLQWNICLSYVLYKTKMKFVTVATHSERYFPTLQDSCRKHGCELIVLQWNQQWRGFAWRYGCMFDYVKTLKKDEIVVFIDAFDVVILQDVKTIEKRFIDMKVPMLFSIEKPYNNRFFRYCYDKTYQHKCQGYGLCAGAYMGYSIDVLNFLSLMLEKVRPNHYDDQVMLMELSQEKPDLFHLDVKNDIFINIHGGTPLSLSFTYFNDDDNQYFKRTEKGIVTHENVYPCILHGVGGTNMDTTVSRLGYTPPLPSKQCKDLCRYWIRSTVHYAPYFKFELVMVIVIIVLVRWMLIICLS